MHPMKPDRRCPVRRQHRLNMHHGGITDRKDYEAMNDTALVEHAIEMGLHGSCVRWKRATIIKKLQDL